MKRGDSSSDDDARGPRMGPGRPGRLKPRHSLPWSPEEELVLVGHHVNVGSRWSAISRYLPGRSDNDVKVGRDGRGAHTLLEVFLASRHVAHAHVTTS